LAVNLPSNPAVAELLIHFEADSYVPLAEGPVLKEINNIGCLDLKKWLRMEKLFLKTE
jgi:hypothetical protein